LDAMAFNLKKAVRMARAWGWCALGAAATPQGPDQGVGQ